jgi:hypothetical protein
MYLSILGAVALSCQLFPQNLKRSAIDRADL